MSAPPKRDQPTGDPDSQDRYLATRAVLRAATRNTWTKTDVDTLLDMCGLDLNEALTYEKTRAAA